MKTSIYCTKLVAQETSRADWLVWINHYNNGGTYVPRQGNSSVILKIKIILSFKCDGQSIRLILSDTGAFSSYVLRIGHKILNKP